MNNKKEITAKDIKANTYSYPAMLSALIISVGVNSGLFFFYHAQKDVYELRETALNKEIQSWKEKAREEFANNLIQEIKQEDGKILIPKGTLISCSTSDCTHFKIELPENY